MIAYAAPTDIYADPTAFIGVFLLYALLCMSYEEVPQYKLIKEEVSEYTPTKVEILQKELEMAHKHQDIIEEDNKNLQESIALLINSTPASHPQNLQSAIINLLQKNTRGLMCKQILTMLSPIMPDLTRKDVNSMLYKMKVKKVVKLKSNFDKVPTWLLTPTS